MAFESLSGMLQFLQKWQGLGFVIKTGELEIVIL
jgi:hypothetical protein